MEMYIINALIMNIQTVLQKAMNNLSNKLNIPLAVIENLNT